MKPRHNLEPFTLLSPAEVVHDYGGNIRHPEIARRIDAARLKASNPHAGPRNMIIKMHTLRALLRGPGAEGEGLKNEDLVRVRREGTFLWYSANLAALQEVMNFLYAECCTRNKVIDPDEFVAIGPATRCYPERKNK